MYRHRTRLETLRKPTQSPETKSVRNWRKYRNLRRKKLVAKSINNHNQHVVRSTNYKQHTTKTRLWKRIHRPLRFNGHQHNMQKKSELLSKNLESNTTNHIQPKSVDAPDLFKKIFVISIRNDRAASMMRRLGPWKNHASILWGTHWQSINLLRWKALNKISTFRVRGRSKLLSRGEVGCYDSHYRVWTSIVQNDIPFALILEDDAEISMIHADRLTELAETLESQKNWDVVVLYTIQASKGLSKQKYIRTSIVPTHRMTGLAGYVVSLAGAKKLIKNAFPISGPVDAYVPKLSSMGKLRLFKAVPPLGGQINRSDSDTVK